MSDLHSQNQDNYDDLLVSIEAGKDILNLLIAVCDDSDCRDRIISDYEAELEPDIRRYRVELARGEPSLRSAIANLVAQEAYLQQQGKAVITVTGVEKLRFFKQFGESRSEQEVFFGYLQWTREALRDFPFSIVLWVTRQIEVLISNESPDFWSWRKGVFRFDTKKTAAITKEEFEPFRLLVEGDRELPSLIPLEDLQDLIARNEQKKGLEDPSLASLYASMGKIYYRRIKSGKCENFQKEYELAIECFQKAMGMQKELRLEAELCYSLTYIALLYKFQGRYSEAEPLYLQALDIGRQWLGEDNLSLANLLNNLAEIYREQGRYLEAELLCLQALEINSRVLGKDNPSLALKLNNLAVIYKFQARYSEAEIMYLQALEIHKKSLPKNHNDLAATLNNLALLYQSQGRYSEAEPLYLQAVEIDRRSLPEDHPSLAIDINNLAGLYRSQERYSEAEPLYLQAVEIDRRSLPEDHPSLANHLNNLALLYSSQGRYSEAEPLYLQAVEILRSKLPEHHPNILTVWENYVTLWREGISKGDLTFEQLQEHPLGEQLLAELQ
ncbi:tetratricopeptide repeat protein [Microcoleus sp. herbarium7]|uniref:tetratricopeptide repeat protein n=1 Tax=Microcoleus sp. herbarium7 TaxID=3055435 RepID=UPI002FD66E11